MEIKKQTAVEWLEELIECGADLDLIKLSMVRAKVMEKQHVMEFLEEYDSYVFVGGGMSAEEYYNEIYGK
jgi:hypothetical protein